MPYFQRVYGYEINRKVELDGLLIHTVRQNFKIVRELARDTKNYFLTGIIEYKNKSTNISLFDLEGILAFIDRLDVIIINKNEFTSLKSAKDKIHQKLYLAGMRSEERL